ncbi:TIGR02391 family protein [Candidatus Falkowbacteria bacterium CG10_big_fil_rev_8_21_14_0_10_44_15]|uniref:TIGR02391 family protein n=1 Tax=Candidatus Falkowbacteria bacterium CG10_big_fil_rev_8_21_14_0_10_44_15 TaxID=1974569 RepID=A0A2H0V005_9BACT|nr:MAG: TIGR02391 family protein [Candidatus Falkowbacteria bacterium CG10_big_fil_rev_8_21_14_0_10_44_15]
MASLTTTDKQILEKLFQMGSGYVLNFDNRTFKEFFRDDLSIDIYDEKYRYASCSKANLMRGFWIKEENKTVGKSILKLIEYIETQILLDCIIKNDFPNERIEIGKQIAKKLLNGVKSTKDITTEATFENGNINITLQDEIFDHVQSLLNDGHYYNAVEEAYKIVREKLKNVTGKEKATEAFNKENYNKIFGRQPIGTAEEDFFEGVKFLHMAIQFLRNEKAHTPARNLEKNLAIHYIVLASLAYDLIDRK